MELSLAPGLVVSVFYLLIYAIALRTITLLVFKKVTISHTYVTMTKKDLVFILLFFGLFFNGFVLFISSGILQGHNELPVVIIIDFILRILTAFSIFGAAIIAKKSEIFEEFA